MTKEELEDMEKGIESINDTIRSDEANFETKITYLNAGAIALTLTFLSFQKGCIYSDCLLKAGIAMCGISLAFNMSLYLIAKIWHRTNINKLIDSKNKGTYLCADDLIDKVCRRIDACNWMTLSLMILGIASLALFVYKNL